MGKNRQNQTNDACNDQRIRQGVGAAPSSTASARENPSSECAPAFANNRGGPREMHGPQICSGRELERLELVEQGQ